MTRLIAVTGATGALGGRVARRVAAGLESADGPGFTAALEGVQTLYLVSAAEAEDRLQQHLTAVRAAAGAGVERIHSRRTTLPPTPRTLAAGP